jgi:hypothetical protein
MCIFIAATNHFGLIQGAQSEQCTALHRWEFAGHSTATRAATSQQRRRALYRKRFILFQFEVHGYHQTAGRPTLRLLNRTWRLITEPSSHCTQSRRSCRMPASMHAQHMISPRSGRIIVGDAWFTTTTHAPVAPRFRQADAASGRNRRSNPSGQAKATKPHR